MWCEDLRSQVDYIFLSPRGDLIDMRFGLITRFYKDMSSRADYVSPELCEDMHSQADHVFLEFCEDMHSRAAYVSLDFC
ncbi:unnamed protein product [Prunus armeniaca]